MELEQLAEDAAAVLMSNATTDLWAVLKGRMSHLLSRSRPQRLAQIEQQLDQLQQELTAARPEASGKGTAHRGGLWQGRILTVLEEHPEAATELAELLASTPKPLSQPGIDMQISGNRADGSATQIIIGKGDLTLTAGALRIPTTAASTDE